MNLFTLDWWRAALLRAVYTLAALAVPVVPQLAAGDVTAGYAASMLSLAVIASLVTSVLSLPELATGDPIPIALAVIYRAVRTIAQVVAAGIGTALILQDVDWQQLAINASIAAAVTLLRALMVAIDPTLPEVGGHPPAGQPPSANRFPL